MTLAKGLHRAADSPVMAGDDEERHGAHHHKDHRLKCVGPSRAPHASVGDVDEYHRADQQAANPRRHARQRTAGDCGQRVAAPFHTDEHVGQH